MSKSKLYFLTDQYYIDFPDTNLMKNKESVNGKAVSRPCFFAFQDTKHPDIYWMVPISSQVDKFHAIKEKKLQKYGFCNTIRFGKVLGREAAFLIQNICPVTKKYLIPYLDKNHKPIEIDIDTASDVSRNAAQVLAKEKRGSSIVFPDIHTIYSQLVEQSSICSATSHTQKEEKEEQAVETSLQKLCEQVVKKNYEKTFSNTTFDLSELDEIEE